MLANDGLLMIKRYDPLYQDVLDYIRTNSLNLPNKARREIENQYALDLRAGGVLPLTRVLHVTASHDRECAKINWMNPGTYNLVEFGTMNFTADVGFASNGTTGYLDTGWRPIVDGGGLYTQNDCHIAHYCADGGTGASNSYGVGAAINTNSVRINPRNASNQVGRVTNGSTSTFNANTNAKAYWVQLRNSSTTGGLRKDNASVSTTIETSAALPVGQNLYISAFNNNGTASSFSTRRIGIVKAGAYLPATERNADYNAFNNYRLSL